jgi:acetyl esterase/lipase
MRAFEASAGFIVPESTTVTSSQLGGVDCLRLYADENGRTAIYFHRGGYVYTRAADALGAIAAMVKRCRLKMVAPDYRRARIPLPRSGRRRGGGLPLPLDRPCCRGAVG